MSYGKRFLHKIYDKDGAYIQTLGNIVSNVPNYTHSINGGLGEMVIDLALSIKEFVKNYENTVIKFGNIVKTYINDDSGTVKIFDGVITLYEPATSETGSESIKVHVLSRIKNLSDTLVKSGTSTTKAFSSIDPSAIVKQLLDLFAGAIHYTGSSVSPTGTSISYTYSYIDYMEAILKAIELCPAYWYFYIDAYNIFYLKSTNFDVIDHKLFIGKQVKQIIASKSVEQLYNAVYFKGGGTPPLYYLYQRNASISEYGKREYKMQDERVTVAATASAMAGKFLDEHDHPASLLQATVIDDSVDSSRGYDIESFRPGQIVQIRHPAVSDQISRWDIAVWDVDYWDFNIIYSLSLPMQILEVDYQFNQAILKLSMDIIDVSKRIEDVNQNLDTIRQEGIPSTPS